ncbi:hypothetical protein [Eubacterium ramulus]|uniref:hypothetical protein n=1 Tax=Eubacterium ramulus TaxID=39490 RepID=UPI00300F2254
MLKKLLAGLMAALTAGTGSGAATQADQFAENFVQEYVSDMEAGMDHVWNELNIEVSYESITKKECEKEIDLAEDEPADYTYYYKIEYTSDEINNQYEHYSNIDFTEFFTSLMQSLEELNQMYMETIMCGSIMIKLRRVLRSECIFWINSTTTFLPYMMRIMNIVMN